MLELPIESLWTILDIEELAMALPNNTLTPSYNQFFHV